MNLAQLNAQFAIDTPDAQLSVVEGKGGFLNIKIANTHADALISMYGGQVLHYKPKHEAHDLMFVSEQAHYQTGKSIKGGVPICWPWFGPDPDDTGRGTHGFVRNMQWILLASSVDTKGANTVTLGLMDTVDTRALWQHPFKLEITISVGQTLSIALTTHNVGTEALALTQALHTYFYVGDIAQTQVLGLEGKQYFDKAAAAAGSTDTVKNQIGVIEFNQEVDRVYEDTPACVRIIDSALSRTVHIQATGSHSTVVWNPWREISIKSADLADDDYQRFVCVESTNAGGDVARIAPNQTHTIGVSYRIESH